MNLNATPETVTAVAQVLKMAAILDDRMGQPDKARIIAWAEQVHRHKLIEADMLDGLQAYYDGPSDRAIGVGDLIHHAKTARRNRVAGEEAADREARQAELDAVKPAPEETVAVAAAFIPGPVRRTPRLEAAEDSLNACVDKASAQAALREYFAAKRESRRLYPPPKPAPRKRRPQPEGANA